MNKSAQKSPHLFHIPVMGTGFSIDTPLKVARYGISSVVSLVDDILLEQMRKHHSDKLGLEYIEISERAEDSRANRVQAYMEFLNTRIGEQVKALQSSPFEPGTEITRYFEMLPDSSLKESYTKMLALSDSAEKTKLQDSLRQQAVPGSIDVNLMTKLDRDTYEKGQKLAPEYADAMSSLRGYAKSSVRSSIIFSAGFNRRLYAYLAKFDDFFLDDEGILRKKIVLKVSDFRSSLIQGKFLARKGLWVSEYRIESGLNCGGHAFASEGFLIGPILEEFDRKKAELVEQLHELYNKALAGMGRTPVQSPLEVRITVQGGIGTAEENRFLLEHYDIDGTGWGTPFLLVPEVTNVDELHMKKLQAAGDNDVWLSDRSPLGIPFWSLRHTASDETHNRRINANKPGSPCPKGFLISNTEFTKVPICHASRVFQKRKLKQVAESGASPEKISFTSKKIMAKACICHDLAGTVTLKLKIDKEALPSICCGPNIVNFSKVATLEEMVGHIYGRLSLLTNSERPHMFIRELSLYVDYLRDELQRASEGLLDKTTKSFQEFKQNLNDAIEYYKKLAEQFSSEQRERFLRELDALFEEIEKVLPEPATPISIAVI
ncbi:MAG: hypothetical protein IID63_00335 [candidate division Zixibacteria bacterium]|nr:hypothetical protein [candidate division Zixibacteria bacterium]